MQKKKKAFSIPGNYRKDAKTVLYFGDALDFVRTIPDESINLIVTSPPYNVGKDYEKKTSIQEYLRTQENMIFELVRVLRKNGSICWQVGTYTEGGEVFPLDLWFYDMFRRRGLKLRNRIIWHYRHGLHATNRFSGRYETILWFTKSDQYTFNLDKVRIPSKYPGKRHYKGPNKGKPSGNPNGKNPSDVWELVKKDWDSAFWDIPNVKAHHPEKTFQPCQFPVELVERCVLALSKKNDLVFDPYAGVASTLIAAMKQGRRAIGSEKEKKYYNEALRRIAAFRNGTIRLREIGTPIHQPSAGESVAQMPKEWSKKRLVRK